MRLRNTKLSRIVNLFRDPVINVSTEGYWKSRRYPRKSLVKAARFFNEIEGETIVEIGSGLQGLMNGNSVLIWASRTAARKIFALDLDAEQISSVKEATKQFPAVEAIEADGIQFLKNIDRAIDLLYLDFPSDDSPGDLPGTGRARAHLEAYQAARDKFRKGSLILIDDTDHIHPWKHTHIITEARKDGFQVRWVGRQTCLQKTT